MDLLKASKIILIFTLSVIYVLAWKIQASILLNWDVSWILQITKRLLAGGSYIKDFFDPNPPMILFLFSPIIFLKKLLSINIILALRIYFFGLSTISLCLCYSFIKSIFPIQEKFLRNIFISTIAATLLILPNYQFGQREHLLLILVFPYLLCTASRLQGNAINNYLASFVGIFAGLGFAIKPYFVLTFLLIELYFIFQQPNKRAWIKTETCIIASILFLYACSLFIYFPDYISIIVPYIARYYNGFDDSSLLSFILYSPAIYCGFGLLYYVCLRHLKSYQALSSILAIALIGFLASYFLQNGIFYYRILPAFSMSFLLMVFLFSLLRTQHHILLRNYIYLIVIVLLQSIFLLYCCRDIWTFIVFNPNVFFIYFAIVFALLLFISHEKKSLLKSCLTIFTIITLGILFSYIAQRTEWYNHQFSLTLILLFFLFSFSLPSKKYYYSFLAIIGALSFAFPVYLTSIDYSHSISRKEKLMPLVTFLQAHAKNKSVYFFSTTITHMFPSIDYAESTSASRLPFFLSLPGLLKQTRNTPFASQQIQDRDYFLKMVAEDLRKNKPEFVFIDASENKAHLGTIQFDYLNYFLKNAEFKKEWPEYSYFTTLESVPTYKFIVYRRKSFEFVG